MTEVILHARLFRHAMQVLDINASQLAVVLDRSTSSVGRYVNGNRPPPTALLRKLAHCCGYSTVAELCAAAF